MFEQQPEEIRRKVNLLAAEALAKSEPSAWFETLYAKAGGDAQQVPWAKLTLHPYLQDWLDNNQPSGEGRSALVIGCGLGDDAEALAKLGYQVSAFDISPTAIAWCQQRFPNSSVNYLVADLFDLDRSWHGAFDFVFECRNIQALPLSVRPKVIESIGQLVAVKGSLLIITRYRDTEEEPDGPPWAISELELSQFQQWGLQETRRDFFFEGDLEGVSKAAGNLVKTLRIEYLRV